MSENAMEVYAGVSAPLRRWIMRQRVKLALYRALNNNDKPRIKNGVQTVYDAFYGRPGVLLSNTTTAIPEWVISNEGLRALKHLGYDLCHTCSGDGWDANSGGGVYICTDCKGKGIVPLEKVQVELGRAK